MSPLARFVVARVLIEVQFWFPTWLLFLESRGYSLVEATLADGLFYAAIACAEVPAGRFSDRIGRKSSLLIATFGPFVVFSLMTQISSVPALLATWVLWGVVWALNSGLVTAYAWELANGSETQHSPTRYLGIVRAATGLGAFVSIVSAGWLFELSPALPYWVTAVLALIATALVLTLPSIRDGEPKFSQRQTQSLGQIWRRDPSALALGVVAAGMLLPTLGLVQPLTASLGLTPNHIALAYAGFTLARSIGAGLSALKPAETSTTVPLSLAAVGLALLGIWRFSAAGDARWVVVLFIVTGMLQEASATLTSARIANAFDRHHRATALSLVGIVSAVFLMVARPTFGFIGQKWTLPTAFGTWGLICMVASVILFAGFRRGSRAAS